MRRLLTEALWMVLGPTIIGVLLVSLALTLTFTTCGEHWPGTPRRASCAGFDYAPHTAQLRADMEDGSR